MTRPIGYEHTHVRRHRCVRCGTCCTRSTCEVGSSHLTGKLEFEPGPCPWLRRDGSRASCGLLVEHPEESKRLLIGRGCGYRAGLSKTESAEADAA